MIIMPMDFDIDHFNLTIAPDSASVQVSAVAYDDEGIKQILCSAPTFVHSMTNLRQLIPMKSFAINKVIFNYPATIVIWEDGTKTVVKVKEGEEFDEWAGLAFCFAKRALGDDFHKVFRKHCDPAVEQKEMALSLFEKLKELKGYTF